MSAKRIDEGQGPDGVVQTVVTEDAEGLAEEAASFLVARLEAAVSSRGQARVVLAGGQTPRAAYRLLARKMVDRRVPVDRLSWFFGDERWVTRDNPESNEGMARECLLAPIGAPPECVHSWDAGDGDPVGKSRLYSELVGRAMGNAQSVPDVTVLGLGADGHTASLFPGAMARLPDGARVPVGPGVPSRAAAVEGDGARGWRLTLCPVFLSTSRYVVFLVAGKDKVEALRRARSGDPSTPGAWIRGAATRFIVTREAMGPERPDYGIAIRHA
jgi:6-phosphogluconolactonase